MQRDAVAEEFLADDLEHRLGPYAGGVVLELRGSRTSDRLGDPPPGVSYRSETGEDPASIKSGWPGVFPQGIDAPCCGPAAEPEHP
jgi:hypothetical protein